MRGKLSWILLAISLLANGVLAGTVYTLINEEDAAAKQTAHMDSVAERLGLSADQREGLLALRENARQGRQGAREGREGRRNAFLAELGKPTFDRARVLAIMDERSAKRRERFANLAGDLHAYLATLTPEQRENFLVMARERGFLRGLFGRRRPPRDR
jgi:uncharacterized membrane protein